MKLLSGIEALTGNSIAIEFDRTITDIASSSIPPRIPIGPSFISPGFVDLQVNGFAGIDFNSSTTTIEDIHCALQAMFSTGVTRCLPTLITNQPAIMLQQLRRFASARGTSENAHAIAGIHVEGPHISPEDGPRGAHPKQWVRPPDIVEYQRWQEAAEGAVRIVTVAPEWPGITRYIEDVVRDGTIVSIGHTHASAVQIHDAVSAGATMSTHLGNGAGSKDRRDPFIEQQLQEDKLTASFIVDGHHLPAEFLRRAIAAKGVDQSILLTDAAAPAMCEPGDYSLGRVDVELHPNGRVTLRGQQRLAGSALRLDHAISNVMRDAGLALPQAIAMATLTPTRVAKLSSAALQPGNRADLVLFQTVNGQIDVLETYLAGRKVFTKSS